MFTQNSSNNLLGTYEMSKANTTFHLKQNKNVFLLDNSTANIALQQNIKTGQQLNNEIGSDNTTQIALTTKLTLILSTFTELLHIIKGMP